MNTFFRSIIKSLLCLSLLSLGLVYASPWTFAQTTSDDDKLCDVASQINDAKTDVVVEKVNGLAYLKVTYTPSGGQSAQGLMDAGCYPWLGVKYKAGDKDVESRDFLHSASADGKAIVFTATNSVGMAVGEDYVGPIGASVYLLPEEKAPLNTTYFVKTATTTVDGTPPDDIPQPGAGGDTGTGGDPNKPLGTSGGNPLGGTPATGKLDGNFCTEKGYQKIGFTCIPSPVGPVANCSGLACKTNYYDLIKTVVNYVLGFVSLAAVVLIIYAGFQYVVSRGDETKAKNARKTIRNTLMGLAVILCSYMIVRLVLTLTEKALK